MKQVLIILIPVILLGLSLAGGFTGNPLDNNVPLAGVFELEEKTGIDTKNVLQIQNLVPKPTSTPTPTTSGSAPTATPTPSPTGTACTPSQKIAVNLLLDTSNSMRQPCDNPLASVYTCPVGQSAKITKMKSAVSEFVTNLRNDDVIGLQAFNTTADPRLSPDKYSVYKDSFPSTIASLQPVGSTSMRDGFISTQQAINLVRQTYTDYNWVLIFLSDGIPTDPNPDPFSNFGGNPYEPQNPTIIADQLKSSGIRIISIALDLDNYVRVNDPDLKTYAVNLMKNLASEPKDKNYKESVTADDLKQIYTDISGQIGRSCP